VAGRPPARAIHRYWGRWGGWVSVTPYAPALPRRVVFHLGDKIHAILSRGRQPPPSGLPYAPPGTEPYDGDVAATTWDARFRVSPERPVFGGAGAWTGADAFESEEGLAAQAWMTPMAGGDASAPARDGPGGNVVVHGGAPANLDAMRNLLMREMRRRTSRITRLAGIWDPLSHAAGSLEDPQGE